MEFVAAERDTASLAAYYASLTEDQKTAIQAVAMDMWDPYIRATRDGLPDGERKPVFDRFHIMREMTKAVDTVRKQEHREFLRDGDDSPLTGTKYVWLFSDENRPEYHADTFATLQALNLKVGRAWAIKEALRTLWTYRQAAAVKRFFTHWYGWAVRSRLEPVKQVAAQLKRHLDGVLRFAKHPITNGVAEGLNSKIMSIKVTVRQRPSNKLRAAATTDHCSESNGVGSDGRRLQAEDRGPASGRQLIDEPMRVRRQTEQDILQVREGRQINEFAALDNGIEERGTASPFETACEEPVLPTNRHDAEHVLGTIVVDGQPAIVNEALERRPLVGQIPNGFTEWRFRQHGSRQGLPLGIDLREQWRRLFLSQGAPAVRIEIGGGLLDLI